jgi:ubiquinone/menaquinone biosynthesis C-methylase UbiE
MPEAAGQPGDAKDNDIARLLANVSRSFEGMTALPGPIPPANLHCAAGSPHIFIKGAQEQNEPVGNEGYTRGMLDRPFREINGAFQEVFGPDRSILQTSIDRIQRTGRLALLDVGCGTANTLRTWRSTVAKLSPCEPEQISCRGVSLHDYRAESAYQRTREACQEGGPIEYIVNDATNMVDVASDSADMILAFTSLLHAEHPQSWLREMLRVARRDTVIFLNAKEEHNYAETPFMETIFALEDAGHTVDFKLHTTKTFSGLPLTQFFCRIALPDSDAIALQLAKLQHAFEYRTGDPATGTLRVGSGSALFAPPSELPERPLLEPGTSTDRQPDDHIGPEGFQRSMLDRGYNDAHVHFVRAFGEEGSPLGVAATIVRRTGHAALLDVGCGTGNMLRTWGEATIERASSESASVSLTGVNLHDYSDESVHGKTREACQEGGSITYVKSDAATMTGVPDDSADVVLAYASMIHSDNSELWLDEMVRVARPDGVLFFSVNEDQNDASAPIMERLYALEEMGHEIEICPLAIKAPTFGFTFVQAMCRVTLNPNAKKVRG